MLSIVAMPISLPLCMLPGVKLHLPIKEVNSSKVYFSAAQLQSIGEKWMWLLLNADRVLAPSILNEQSDLPPFFMGLTEIKGYIIAAG